MNLTQRKIQLKALNKAVEIFGTQKKLAGYLGITQQAISRWVKNGQIPLKQAIEIESLTHKIVLREQLRPDYF